MVCCAKRIAGRQRSANANHPIILHFFLWSIRIDLLWQGYAPRAYGIEGLDQGRLVTRKSGDFRMIRSRDSADYWGFFVRGLPHVCGGMWFSGATTTWREACLGDDVVNIS